MSISVTSLEIPDVKIVTVKKHGDSRGFFSETYTKRAFVEAGIDADFVQDNHVLSGDKGTVRGLHFVCPMVNGVVAGGLRVAAPAVADANPVSKMFHERA